MRSGNPAASEKLSFFRFLGEGVVDWKRFFVVLRNSGYSGYLSLEFENDRYLNNVCDGKWSIAAVELRKRVEKFLPTNATGKR